MPRCCTVQQPNTRPLKIFLLLCDALEALEANARAQIVEKRSIELYNQHDKLLSFEAWIAGDPLAAKPRKGADHTNFIPHSLPISYQLIRVNGLGGFITCLLDGWIRETKHAEPVQSVNQAQEGTQLLMTPGVHFKSMPVISCWD